MANNRSFWGSTRSHGMACARGWGLNSVAFQARITAIAVNLKRIAAIAEGEMRIIFANFGCIAVFGCKPMWVLGLEG